MVFKEWNDLRHLGIRKETDRFGNLTGVEINENLVEEHRNSPEFRQFKKAVQNAGLDWNVKPKRHVVNRKVTTEQIEQTATGIREMRRKRKFKADKRSALNMLPPLVTDGMRE